MIIRRVLSILAVLLAASLPSLAQTPQAGGEPRIALVVGNADYPNAPLATPLQDGNEVAAALREAGFDVMLLTNGRRREMERAIRDFRNRLSPGAVGFFYFAGYAIQDRGVNYILPVDAQIESEADISLEGISVETLLDQMTAPKSKLSVVVLDAARASPAERRFRQTPAGLAAVGGLIGTIVAHAATPGRLAPDRQARTSLYTEELVRALKTPGLEIRDVFRQTQTAVSRRSNGDQVPWDSTFFTGEFVVRSRDQARPPGRQDNARRDPPAGEPSVAEPDIEPLDRTYEVAGSLVTVHAQPRADAPSIFTLLQGERLNVAGRVRDRNWFYVVLENGRRGYVPGELIRPVGSRERGPEIAGPPPTRPDTSFPERPGGPGSRFRDCAECPLMVVIPAGEFDMGSGEPREGPVRRVTISRPFAIGQAEVSVEEWQACLREGGCKFTPSDFGWGGRDVPVVEVSWVDAQDYVRWLSRKTGQTYRLPSEAEWEYAARGNTRTAYWWGDDIGRGNTDCKGCGSPYDTRRPAPASAFRPNPFGLVNTLGNVAEWVQDCWNETLAGAPRDGRPWLSGDCRSRVLRGGAFNTAAKTVRSAYRFKYDNDVRYIGNGFRVVRELN